MIVKPKKCKGIGKAHGFDGCDKPSVFRKYGLCNLCLAEWIDATKEGKGFMDSLVIKSKAKVVNNQKKKDRAEKSLSIDWAPKLQDEVNSIVRTIDHGLLCLARNQRGQMHAGHVFARGGNQTIRYNLHNIHRQSAQSNHHQNDDGLLREGVVKEYGQKYMDFISQLRQTPSLKLSNVEYRELTAMARLILKELKRANKIYTVQERIELRNRTNKELGIYELKYCTFKN
jgi:hypothetical protein